MRRRRSIYVPDSQRWNLESQPGVLAGDGRGSRSDGTEGARREIRGIRHAARDDDEKQHCDCRRSENRVVQGQRGKYPGDCPAAVTLRRFRRWPKITGEGSQWRQIEDATLKGGATW